jgi:hypothetical protein
MFSRRRSIPKKWLLTRILDGFTTTVAGLLTLIIPSIYKLLYTKIESQSSSLKG